MELFDFFEELLLLLTVTLLQWQAAVPRLSLGIGHFSRVAPDETTEHNVSGMETGPVPRWM